MKKKPTKAQEWQRKRYQAKGSLTSARNRFRNLLETKLLIVSERIEVRRAIYSLEQLLFEWELSNKSSKHKYLHEHKND